VLGYVITVRILVGTESVNLLIVLNLNNFASGICIVFSIFLAFTDKGTIKRETLLALLFYFLAIYSYAIWASVAQPPDVYLLMKQGDLIISDVDWSSFGRPSPAPDKYILPILRDKKVIILFERDGTSDLQSRPPQNIRVAPFWQSRLPQNIRAATLREAQIVVSIEVKKETIKTDADESQIVSVWTVNVLERGPEGNSYFQKVLRDTTNGKGPAKEFGRYFGCRTRLGGKNYESVEYGPEKLMFLYLTHSKLLWIIFGILLISSIIARRLWYFAYKRLDELIKNERMPP
jgi:hypothetical protein